ncbi:glycosyltransferase [Emticicia sp. CRIBPO]|uniref:glycosyltransferase family 2 protein n=1 Tax=Emticicia sp. CRIBPO TaxID=2683258 RepID=UPI001412FBD4|nr:glycosyltransferase family 2 protein [Emticicia sp. CRIBPO]NBA84591.1 glycosyltransferase [Emticicia sp. CRIBPO]
MIPFLIFVFWFSLFLVFYTYIGYGILIYVLVKIKKALGKAYKKDFDDQYLPEVTLIIPAYNEMSCIKEKVENSLGLDYPAHLLRLLFVTEGSDDGTTEFVRELSGKNASVHYLGGSERRGKIEAMNIAMKTVSTPIVIFSDANTTLNKLVIKNIIRHFKDASTGAVAGEKRIMMDDNEAAAGAGEGLYWKYESFLKKLDTELYSVVGAAGELFAVRTELFEEVEKDTLLDDFMISLRIAARGFRVIYEPDAYASERPSFSIGDEQKRKVRIAAGGFQSIARLGFLLNIFKYGWLSFQYVSHRAMRWAVAPFCLPLIFVVNVALVALSADMIYIYFLAGQILFYGLAILGNYFENRKIRIKLLFVPYYFSFMNYCAIRGFFRYRNGLTSGIWEKVRRAE